MLTIRVILHAVIMLINKLEKQNIDSLRCESLDEKRTPACAMRGKGRRQERRGGGGGKRVGVSHLLSADGTPPGCEAVGCVF
jgi:hypothetical protein